MYSILVNSRFLYNSIVYTYVKGGRFEYAVANTVVVYAYNTWYPCTCTYTILVQVVRIPDGNPCPKPIENDELSAKRKVQI